MTCRFAGQTGPAACRPKGPLWATRKAAFWLPEFGSRVWSMVRKSLVEGAGPRVWTAAVPREEGTMSTVSTAAAQADAFYSEVLKTGSVWTVQDVEGIPAPMTADGYRSMPFWSLRSRAERVVANVPAYRTFEVIELSAEKWRRDWLPGLAEDGIHVGLNWSGPRATGYDVEPGSVEAALTARAPADE